MEFKEFLKQSVGKVSYKNLRELQLDYLIHLKEKINYINYFNSDDREIITSVIDNYVSILKERYNVMNNVALPIAKIESVGKLVNDINKIRYVPPQAEYKDDKIYTLDNAYDYERDNYPEYKIKKTFGVVIGVNNNFKNRFNRRYKDNKKNNKTFKYICDVKYYYVDDWIYDNVMEDVNSSSEALKFFISLQKREIIEKNFELNIPENMLNKKDLMQFMVYYGPKEYMFRLIRIEYEMFKYNPLSDINKIHMKSNIGYKMLNDVVKKTGDNTCVADYLFYALKGIYKRVTHSDITQKLLKAKTSKKSIDGYTTEDIINFRDKFFNRISIYALDPFLNKTNINNTNYKLNNGNVDGCIAFIVNDNHLFPITDENIIKKLKFRENIDLGRVNDSDIIVKRFRVVVDDVKRFKHINGKTDYKVIHVNKIIDEADHKFTYIYMGDMRQLTNKVIKKHGHITGFKFTSNCDINAFMHPLGHIIVDGKNFLEVKDITTILYNKFNNVQFMFMNQTITKIGNDLLQLTVGNFKKSHYNFDVIKCIDENYPKALCKASNIALDKVNVCVDIIRDYTSVLYYNEENYPVYDIFDYFQEFNVNDDIDVGEYIIPKDVNLPFKMSNVEYVSLPAGLYGHHLISYLLEKQYINKKDISHVIKASYHLDNKTFKPFVKTAIDVLGSKSKNVINQTIGNFNSKHIKQYYGCTTTSKDIVNGLYIQEIQEKKRDFKYFKLGEFYLCRSSTKKRVNSDNTSINRHVISGGIMNLIKSMEKYYIDGVNFISGYNTDSIFIRNKNNSIPIINDVVEEYPEGCELLNYIGKYMVKDNEKLRNFRTSITKNINMNDYNSTYDNSNNKLFIGGGGCGKTHKLITHALESKKNNKNIAILSFTNKAVNVIKQRIEKINKITQVDDVENISVKTICSYFGFGEIKTVPDQNLDILYIDEYSMIPKKYIRIIYEYVHENNIQIIMSGDSNQLCAIEKHNPINYVESYIYKSLFGNNIEELQYIEESGRYDNELHKTLQHLLSNGNINYKFKKINKNALVNICTTNETRKRVNTNVINKYIAKNKIIINKNNIIKFKYQGQYETYPIFKGMRIIATNKLIVPKIINNSESKENKEYNVIFNQDKFTIKFINHKYIGIVSDNDNDTVIKICIKKFFHSFVPNYCTTIHRYQGDEINEPYNIFEIEKMTINDIYTCLSRATTINNIYIEDQPSLDYVFKKQTYFTNLYIKPKKIKYANAFIYKNKEGYSYSLHKNNKFDVYVYCPCNDEKVIEKYVKYFSSSDSHTENSQNIKKNNELVYSVNIIEKNNHFRIQQKSLNIDILIKYNDKNRTQSLQKIKNKYEAKNTELKLYNRIIYNVSC